MDFHLDGLHNSSTRVTRSYTDHGGCRSIHKMAHFIVLNENTTAKDVAATFVREIWKLHGLPTEIISDMDAKFSREF